MPQKGKRLDTMKDGFENMEHRVRKADRCLIRAPGRGAQKQEGGKHVTHIAGNLN